MDDEREVFWIASSKKDIRTMPPDVRRSFGYALWLAQRGERHEDAKSLKGFGGGSVLEVVASHQGSAFRFIYTVRFAEAIYALHCFQKKSKKGVVTPKSVMDLVRKRLRDAEKHYEEWRAQREEADAESSEPDDNR